MEDRITLNVGGVKFQCRADTLRSLPGTKLSTLSAENDAYDAAVGEYYFDRNPTLFNYILDAYRYGRIHVTAESVCGLVLKEELEYWGIGEEYIADCCWAAFVAKEREIKMRNEVINFFDKIDNESAPKADQCISRWRLGAWNFLENPMSSMPAKLWAFFFLAAVITSVTLLVMFTHRSFRINLVVPKRNVTGETNPKMLLQLTTTPYPMLVNIDIACMVLFGVELLLRFILSPDKKKFVLSFYNIIDCLCVLSTLCLTIVEFTNPSYLTDDRLFGFVYFLSVLGVMRTIRMIKLARHFTGMKILLLALKASLREVLLLIMLIVLGMLFFSTLIYFAEFFQESHFVNIPIGFWWSIVTMTTVGYGDKHPSSGWGYLVGAICALSGMLSTGLPIPVIASNFNLYYNVARAITIDRKKGEKRKKLTN
ncbi:unnamed protein product [Dimorphilus gyrociliatus]|uniref:BTB domain-containing protein n=1 Tax=Dimorphilus gyrociliatus TaxID=2664684 RepID=A0A7I8VY25_9ANNE|nr:unnamed protein product [Dimorphilus gyrociliatus]